MRTGTFSTTGIGRAITVCAAATGMIAAFAPIAHAADQSPAAGSCVHPVRPAADDVEYRYQSRTNAWRVRPVFTSVPTHAAPGAAMSNGALSQLTQHTRTSAWYLVLDARQIGRVCWLAVRLPAVPNQRVGWVSRDQVVAQRTPFQVEVDLSNRSVSLYVGGVRRLTRSVVIGTSDTPTPPSGRATPFAFYDAQRGGANDFTGTWQLATTAKSVVDPELGRIGLHGRGGASLSSALGTAASHGCVRADNATVDAVMRTIGLGRLFGVPFVITT